MTSSCRGGGWDESSIRMRQIDSMERLRRWSFEWVLPGHGRIHQREPDAMAREFLRHLPRVSYSGSCVYHGRTGCGLPREMRAAICNRFYCGSLREQWTALAAPTALPALLVATDDRGAVVRATRADRTGRVGALRLPRTS